jgi:hypothetical protein
LKKRLNITLHLFALLSILLIPAANKIVTFQDTIATFLFGDLINALGYEHHQFSSDTIALNLLLLFIFVFSLGLSFILPLIKKWEVYASKVIALIRLIMVYYLASRLLIYGFDKLFNAQFYQPEPNTLFTPLGEMSKDILFWSTMGTSKSYSIITGLLEILPACLLLFRRTRTAGLIISAFVLVNVLAINFGFDISVKLYSLFLLLLTLMVLWPNIQRIIQFLAGKEAQLIEELKTFDVFYKPFVKGAIKALLIGLFFLEACFFVIQTGEINDDNAERPYLHGAYEYDTFGSEGHLPDVTKFFIHRRGFIIFETERGMVDYKLEIDKVQQMFICTDYAGTVNLMPYKLYDNETRIDLEVKLFDDYYGRWMTFEKIDLEELPALKDEFHWTIDSFLAD